MRAPAVAVMMMTVATVVVVTMKEATVVVAAMAARRRAATVVTAAMDVKRKAATAAKSKAAMVGVMEGTARRLVLLQVQPRRSDAMPATARLALLRTMLWASRHL